MKFVLFGLQFMKIEIFCPLKQKGKFKTRFDRNG